MDDLKIVPTPKGAIAHLPDVSAELFRTDNGWTVGQFAQTGRMSRTEVEGRLLEVIQANEGSLLGLRGVPNTQC